jgi:DNA replication and repair protein RecF
MITSIRLQNFRSYQDSSFEFDPGVNIVVGPNASGKTNLLEAVMVLARGGSFRARDIELVKFKQPWSRLEGNFERHSRVLKIEPAGDQINKTFVIDDKPFKRLSLERTVPVVLFEPNHLQLVSRGPETRRDYFDDLLERSQPGYKTLSASYRRTLAQRNALLKHNRAHASQQLFAWNIRLSELGAQVVVARQQLVDQINKTISKNYGRIAGKRSKVKLKYDCQFPAENYASRMLSKLEKNTELDFSRGFTSSGPHREDILFYLNNQPSNATASRGEARSLLLALKIFELELIEKTRSRPPIFLLDDVFSELDGRRRRMLVDSLGGRQTIITTTDADSIIDYFATGQHKLISVTT